MPEPAKTLLNFLKYHGAGNDFIAFDLRTENIDLTDVEKMNRLCDRHFGIGADGILGLSLSDKADFKLTYLNADGRLGSLCGNGSRCAVAFALDSGFIQHSQSITIEAADGIHKVDILDDQSYKLHFKDVQEIRPMVIEGVDCCFLNTGSPHVVVEIEDLEAVDVQKEGALLRNSQALAPDGANINFIKRIDSKTIAIRTFERGVEAETLACGTGAVAAALYTMFQNNTDGEILIEARGGLLSVGAKARLRDGITTQHPEKEPLFNKVWLNGPAVKVFEGSIWL